MLEIGKSFSVIRITVITVAFEITRMFDQIIRNSSDYSTVDGRNGLDFTDLTEGFFATAILRRSHSGRTLAFGRHGDFLVVAVVFRPLGMEALSIVSMRRANTRERRLFHG